MPCTFRVSEVSDAELLEVLRGQLQACCSPCQWAIQLHHKFLTTKQFQPRPFPSKSNVAFAQTEARSGVASMSGGNALRAHDGDRAESKSSGISMCSITNFVVVDGMCKASGAEYRQAIRHDQAYQLEFLRTSCSSQGTAATGSQHTNVFPAWKFHQGSDIRNGTIMVHSRDQGL